MHEAAVMQGVVRTVLTCMHQAGATRVTHVQMAIGVSGHFTADAAAQYFEALVQGTPAEGASLSIQWLPATFQCFSCLHQFERCEPAAQVRCPRCGESALEVGHQEVCSVSAIDVAFEHGEELAPSSRIPSEEPETAAQILFNEDSAPWRGEGDMASESPGKACMGLMLRREP